MIEVMVDEGIQASFSQSMLEKTVAISCFEAKNIQQPSVCIRFSSNEAVQQLNAQWRNQDKVTDVLSFPMQEAEALDSDESLGDMILAMPFVRDEAQRLAVAEDAHIYHLIAHSTLHLLGYDHILDADTENMQRLENNILMKLGLHKPYPEWD
ncbi:MAG: rRNA maturation RNase YbeY [Ghiorsea sp.]|nr:rRNA maturation RNase YbeY [Ghiorsea sp.]